MIKHLSQILSDNFRISKEELDEAQRISTEKGEKTREILLRKKIITESQLLEALSIQYNIPFWPDLPFETIGNDVTANVPIQFLKKYIMVPLANNSRQADLENDINPDGSKDERKNRFKTQFIIAINDPTSFQPLDDLVSILGLNDYDIVLSTRDAILSAINLAYDLNRDSAEQLVQDMEENEIGRASCRERV